MSQPMQIGALRTRLVLEAATRNGDGGGGASVTWTAVDEVWARVAPATGTESFVLDRIAGKVSHEIVIRYRDDVTLDKRFRAGERIFDIRAAFDPDGRQQWVRCLAEERDL